METGEARARGDADRRSSHGETARQLPACLRPARARAAGVGRQHAAGRRRGRACTRAQRRAGARRRHGTLDRRLLPHAHDRHCATRGGARAGREAAAHRRRRLGRAGICACRERGTRRARGRRPHSAALHDTALPVRSAGLGSAPGTGDIRLRLSPGMLHARAEARLRLFLAAHPASRQARRPTGSQGTPRGGAHRDPQPARRARRRVERRPGQRTRNRAPRARRVARDARSACASDCAGQLCQEIAPGTRTPVVSTMSNAPGPAVLRVIRLSLLFGVLAFGAVAYFTQAQRQPSLDTDALNALRLAVLALSAAVVVAAFVFRAVRTRSADPAAIANTTIIAWAVGEAPAILGAVTYFLSGDSQPFLVGVTAFLLMLVAMPLPE